MKVEFTERGDRAFDEVLIFLMEQQEVPMDIAEDVEESIEKAARELSSFPDRGRPEEDLSE